MRKLLLLPFTILLALLVFSSSSTAWAASAQQIHVHVHQVHTALLLPGVTCSGNGCTGKDPSATGCAATASTVLSRLILNGVGQQIGLIELRFSSACQTNWARTTSSINAVPMGAIVERAGGIDGSFVFECTPATCNNTTATSVFTPMVWAPDVAALAQGDLFQNGQDFDACVTQSQSALPCPVG